MIFIAVKFSIRPEVADQWLARVAPFTAATRAEPGNLFFEWSRSADRPNQFVLLEAFRDRAAGEAHVHSEHFKAAMAWMPDAVAATPDIIHVEAPGDGWSPMGNCNRAPPRDAPRHRSVTRRPWRPPDRERCMRKGIQHDYSY